MATHVVAVVDGESLSARRAWIEIGSLDDILAGVNGRSPQGERG